MPLILWEAFSVKNAYPAEQAMQIWEQVQLQYVSFLDALPFFGWQEKFAGERNL